jgi:hypothetical protein
MTKDGGAYAINYLIKEIRGVPHPNNLVFFFFLSKRWFQILMISLIYVRSYLGMIKHINQESSEKKDKSLHRCKSQHGLTLGRRNFRVFAIHGAKKILMLWLSLN